MKRITILALAALTAGCVGDDRAGFAEGGTSTDDDDDVNCEVQEFSYLVQDIVDADGIQHQTCDAPSVAEDGPAFSGWFSPAGAAPGGLLSISVFTVEDETLAGRTVVLDAPEVIGHSRFELTDDHIIEGGARFQIHLRHDLAAGPQSLAVALLDDYGDDERIGPSITVPVTVVPVADEPRGLRIALNFWSEDDPDARPDVNLQVFEPDGHRIDASDPVSSIGGMVEYDGNAECEATENLESMSWPQDGAAGEYSAFAFFRDDCGYQTDFHWTVSFSYFDRLLGVWEGEISAPHEGGDPEDDVIDLSYVNIQ
jgi:hypothetical protein